MLNEVRSIKGMTGGPEYGPRLPSLVRAAIAVGDPALGAAIAHGVRPVLPIREHALVTVDALLQQARGDHAGAVLAFTDAVARWAEFGNLLEEAYARLGMGRSLQALADPTAPECLSEARALFSGMGAQAPLAVCDLLLGSLSGQTS